MRSALFVLWPLQRVERPGCCFFPAHSFICCSSFLRTHGASHHSACVALLANWVATPRPAPALPNAPLAIPPTTAFAKCLNVLCSYGIHCLQRRLALRGRCSRGCMPFDGPICHNSLKPVAGERKRGWGRLKTYSAYARGYTRRDRQPPRSVSALWRTFLARTRHCSKLSTTIYLFATRSPHTQVDRLVELSLKVFGDKHGDSNKDILVYASLGLAKVSLRTLRLTVRFVEDCACLRVYMCVCEESFVPCWCGV